MQRFRIIALTIGLLGCVAFAVDIETVPVGDPGNDMDALYTPPHSGSVGYTYNVGKYEVTAGQYAAFLNAVAASDTYGLYNPQMADPVLRVGCNIQRAGTPGHYTYSVAADWANRPVNYVSLLDACRFANWLHNGQPVGNQDLSTTEDGAYFLNGSTTLPASRKSNWKWAVPTDNEWYKAAYFKGGARNAGYWTFATQSDRAPGRDMADLSGGNANYDTGTAPFPIDDGRYTTAVGQFQNSPSAYGTFDQNGNVREWCECRSVGAGFSRGGSFMTSYLSLYSPAVPMYGATMEGNDQGFRVVYLPEPATLALLAVSGIMVLRRRRIS